MQKFKVGDQYLTKGGWRAVVVTNIKNGLLVWHENENKTFLHHLDGSHTIDGYYHLDKPYTEPRKGTVWVGVWEDVTGGIQTLCTTTEQEYEDIIKEHDHFNWIASFKHDWTENEKL